MGIDERYPGKLRETIRQALSRRTELETADAACARAELNLTSVQRQRYPWFSSVQLTRQSRGSSDPPTWVPSRVELPIFKWTATHTAAAESAKCELRLKALKSAVVAEVDELLVRLADAATKLEDCSGTVLDPLECQVAGPVRSSRQSNLTASNRFWPTFVCSVANKRTFRNSWSFESSKPDWLKRAERFGTVLGPDLYRAQLTSCVS